MFAGGIIAWNYTSGETAKNTLCHTAKSDASTLKLQAIARRTIGGNKGTTYLSMLFITGVLSKFYFFKPTGYACLLFANISINMHQDGIKTDQP
jgi:hypothetical protein